MTKQDILQLLEAKYKSHYRIAKESGLSESTIGRIFNGETQRGKFETSALLASLLTDDVTEQNTIIRILQSD